MTSSIVTVESFIKSNPLWTVVKLREGRNTLSYKSNNALYLVECKQCGDQAEKPGNTITQCRRCKYSLVREGDDWKVLAPFDEKDIRIAKDNMKKPPKKFTFVEEELPEKREKKVEVEEVEEEELPKKRGKKEKVVVEEKQEEDAPAPSVGLDLDDLFKIATTTSGHKSQKQLDYEQAKIESYEKKRQAKIEEKKQRDIEDNLDIDGLTGHVEESILPKSKQNERSKVTDKNCVVKEEDVVVKKIRLKPGCTYYCKESGILFIVDDA